MHELSLAQALVDEVERIKEKEHAAEVISVSVTIGAICGVDIDSFKFVFPLAAEGTSLARATLVIRESPAAIHCEDCGRESVPDLAFLRCGACGSRRVRISGGREFLIRSVEMLCDEEQPDGAAAQAEKRGERDV